MRCSCLGIMTPLSVRTMYCVTLKAWQADPKGQFWDMNASVYVCVCARACVFVSAVDLLIAHARPPLSPVGLYAGRNQ